jgi:hypothetical protein
MRRLPTFVVAAALVYLVAPVAPAAAQAARTPESTVARAAAGGGSIRGLVLDTQGRPLVGAMVSALGSTVAFVLTGGDGRFRFDALPPGAYAVRVHLDGFAPSQRQMVEVKPGGAPSIVSVALKSLAASGTAADGRPILAASVVPLDSTRAAFDPASAEADGADSDHSETAWRLRHLKRSVLKGAETGVTAGADGAAGEDASGSFFGRAFESSARLAASVISDFPLSGQVNLFTTSIFGAPALEAPNALMASSAAYISLGSTAGPVGDWAVSAATTPGNVGSWFVSGTLTARPSSEHHYVGGLVYSAQRISSADPFALAAISGGGRSVGRIYGFDEWVVSKRLALGYGLSYMWQDYLSAEGLVSPRVSVTISPVDRFRVHAIAARSSFAPGADEFVNAIGTRAGIWLPAQRSFSPWSEQQGLHAQTTDHFELGVEREIAAYVVGVRSFRQRVNDQAGAIFTAPSLDHPAASLGHYYLANLGDVDARGWGVSVSRPIFGRVRGSIEYSVTRTRWVNGPGGVMALWMGEEGVPEEAQIRDLTTSVETAIPQTSTRVYVLYKLNSGFARQTLESRQPGFGARFDVQVNQSLPFLNFTSADWELLVAICNLFRDATGERSVYDELLVIRPPTRVVGGVRVRF